MEPQKNEGMEEEEDSSSDSEDEFGVDESDAREIAERGSLFKL